MWSQPTQPPRHHPGYQPSFLWHALPATTELMARRTSLRQTPWTIAHGAGIAKRAGLSDSGHANVALNGHSAQGMPKSHNDFAYSEPTPLAAAMQQQVGKGSVARVHMFRTSVPLRLLSWNLPQGQSPATSKQTGEHQAHDTWVRARTRG